MNVQMEERLSRANQLREDEKYDESMREYTAALVDLVDTGDWQGLIHCLGGQTLIYKILAGKSNSPVYKGLMLSFAKETYEIAEQYKDELDGYILGIAYRVYGDALHTVGESEDALVQFQNALSITSADIPEKGMLKAHIGDIKYSLGEKEVAISLLSEAISDIKSGDQNSYNILVWETGALNKLANIYSKEGEMQKALTCVQEALAISKSRKLPIREKESQKLFDKISSGQTGS